MKVIQLTIPVAKNTSIYVQEANLNDNKCLSAEWFEYSITDTEELRMNEIPIHNCQPHRRHYIASGPRHTTSKLPGEQDLFLSWRCTAEHLEQHCVYFFYLEKLVKEFTV